MVFWRTAQVTPVLLFIMFLAAQSSYRILVVGLSVCWYVGMVWDFVKKLLKLLTYLLTYLPTLLTLVTVVTSPTVVIVMTERTEVTVVTIVTNKLIATRYVFQPKNFSFQKLVSQFLL